MHIIKSTGIIGHWPLNADNVSLPTIDDISRNGNDGTATDVTLTTGIHGEADGACLFNGITSAIDTGKDMIGILPLTIEVWICSTSVYGGQAILVNEAVLFRYDGGSERIRFTGDWATYANSAGGSVTLNNFHHICVTRNAAGDETSIYVDGVLSGAANQNSGAPVAGTANIFIGAADGGFWAFEGKIAKLKCRSFVMSAWQVKRLYDSYGV